MVNGWLTARQKLPRGTGSFGRAAPAVNLHGFSIKLKSFSFAWISTWHAAGKAVG
jgi:hypothetical protein